MAVPKSFIYVVFVSKKLSDLCLFTCGSHETVYKLAHPLHSNHLCHHSGQRSEDMDLCLDQAKLATNQSCSHN